MQSSQRALVPCGDGLEKRRRLTWRTDLADDDPIRAHPQRVHDEVGHADAALATRNALKMNDVRVWQDQLVGVLDHDKALVSGYLAGQGPQQRALTGPRRAGDQHIAPRRHHSREKIRSLTREPTGRLP